MINTQKHLSSAFVHNIAMGFANLCFRRSASRFASSVCGGQVRYISTVVNRPSLVHNTCPLRPFVSRGLLYSTAAIDEDRIRDEDWIDSEQAILDVMENSDSEYQDSEYQDPDVLNKNYLLETFEWCMWKDGSIVTRGGFPFKIEDVPGNRTVTLTREYNGEHIKVVLSMPLLPADNAPSNESNDADHGAPSNESNDDDHDAPSNGSNDADHDAPCNESNDADDSAVLPFVVTVTKKSGRSLELSCRKVSDEIIIDAINVNLPGEDPKVLRNIFDTLETQFSSRGTDLPVLRKTFKKYLEIRGLGHDTFQSLNLYMLNKMKQEYWLWLDHVTEFFEEIIRI